MTARKFRPSPDLADGIAAVMDRCRVQAGGGKLVAHALGLSEAQVSRLCNRHAPDMPDFAQMAHLTEALGVTAAAEWLAMLAGALCPAAARITRPWQRRRATWWRRPPR